MKLRHFQFLFLFLMVISCTRSEFSFLASEIHSDSALFEAMEQNRQWPSYRGYFASGSMNDTNLPDSFNVESAYNVAWNVEIPGMGLSCPVIWDDRVYITSAISENDTAGFLPGMYGDIAPVEDSSEHSWMLYCIDRNSGKMVWEREMHRGIPSIKRHPKSTHANTTVATDGMHVVVFLGSEGLYCYDRNGDLLWERDFGIIKAAWHIVEGAEWEFSSSPVIFRNRVVLQADALNQAFVAVLDLESGETIWKKERDEIPGWCTPNVYFDGSVPRVLVNGYQHRGAYDLETGEEIWKMTGGGDIPVPVPIVWKDLLYFNSAHGRHRPLMSLHNHVKGEIPYPENDSTYSDDFAWFHDRGGAYMTSPVVYDSLLYELFWNGSFICFDARSGEFIYHETIKPASFIAAPVISDGRIYTVSEIGDVYILKTGREFEVLKEIPLGEVSLVTPAMVPGMIIFRTASRLIAVGNS